MIWALAGCVLPGPYGRHPPPPPPLETPAIASITLDCATDDDQWTLEVTATTWTGGGQSGWTEDLEYFEAHAVPVVSSAPDASSETLKLTLAIVSDWRLQAPNSSTVFTCGDKPAVAFDLFDVDGVVADCAMFDGPASEPTLGCE